MKRSLHRMHALLKKEVRQLLRERSNLAVGLLLPLALVLLFGYGLSFDVKNAPLALVLADNSAEAHEAAAALYGSRWIAPQQAHSMAQAEDWLRAGQVDGIVHVAPDFARRAAAGQARVQLILNGSHPTTAQALEGYVSGALAAIAARQMERGGGKAAAGGARVDIAQRMWFNAAGISTWYLVPGLLVLVLTLIGAFLTSLLIAREWERGTLESLFVTPVRPLEVLLAKIAPYLVVGLIDLALCLLAARFLFDVPVRGPLAAIVLCAMLYLAVSLLLGLVISGITRNQFLASQMALIISFLPALMLSGFIFDLRNVPAGIDLISQILPATHFMALVKTLFLAGGTWAEVARVSAILLLYIALLGFAAHRTLRKTLDGRT